MGSVYQTHKPSGGNDLYLRLKDGDKVKLRVVSEPVITVYKEGDRPRYAWVVFNRELGKPQVFNAGVSIYNQIADLTEEWGEPQKFDVVIKRTGSGLQDTEYSVVPVKTSNDLTKEELAEVEKIDLVQATKGKWLADYVEDNELPDPIDSTPRETVTDEELASLDKEAPTDWLKDVE